MRLLPKIVLAVVVPVVLGAGVVIFVLTGSWQRTLEAELVGQARRSLVERLSGVPATLTAARDSLRLLALSPVLRSGDPERIGRALHEWKRQTGQFEGFYFHRFDGAPPVADAVPLPFAARDDLAGLLRGNEVIGRALPSRIGRGAVLPLLVPVYGGDGGLVGALAATVALDSLINRGAADWQATNARFLVVDSDGRLLAGGIDGDPPLFAVPDRQVAPVAARIVEQVRAVVAGEELGPDLRIRLGDEAFTVLHARVPMLPWRLVLVQPESTLFAPLRDARRLAWVVVFAASFAALALALMLYRFIVRPIRLLTEAQRRLQAGDRGVRAPAAGGDELAAVGASFNRMAESLEGAEALRQASESQLQAVFNASPAAIIVSDVARNYVSLAANDAWEKQFMRRRDEVMGMTGEEMGLWVSIADRRRVLDEIDRHGSIDGFETQLVRGDGAELRCRISARKVGVGDRELLVMVQEDVTELHRAESALQQLNSELDARVRARTDELNRANEELTATLDTLRRAQGDLVRSEKLAALGSLVAGVAHELNTPIGNSVTVASTLVENSTAFADEMQSGLKRSVLTAYVDGSRRAAELLLANLQRAAHLVSSFKQVAVDQTSEQRRRFEVAEVVDEILAMLRPQLRKRPLDVRTDIPPGLLLDSYPGPFGQVIANLVDNAAVHAFADGHGGGVIRIEAEAAADGVHVCIRDDGIGIPADHLGRIFDPFFTTRLGQGGSGLGLNIVYNIVSGILGGEIRVESQPGQGCCFTLVLPEVAPEPPAEAQ